MPHIQLACRQEKIGCAILGGGATQRAEVVAAFTSPSSTTTLLLLHAEQDCAGLTLTAANHLFLLDQPLSTNILAQLTARIARLGQRKPCYVYHLLLTPLDEACVTLRVCGTPQGGETVEVGVGGGEGGGGSVIVDGQTLPASHLLALLKSACTERS